jgi:hypothetical protein
MCAFDATMAMALSRRVFLTLYFPTGLADHVEMPIIVTVENPIVFTMTSVWPTIASQGYCSYPLFVTFANIHVSI